MVASWNKTIEFYKFWHGSRERFPGRHEIGTFCQLSHDPNKICTLHANCCLGLGNKLHDLSGAFDYWKNFTTKSADERGRGNFHRTVPQKCTHPGNYSSVGTLKT
jgi:hypothetical protein